METVHSKLDSFGYRMLEDYFPSPSSSPLPTSLSGLFRIRLTEISLHDEAIKLGIMFRDKL